MPSIRYLFYQCQNPGCGLRFPAQASSLQVERCPRCKSPLERAVTMEIEQEAPDRPVIPDSPIIEVLLDNIRSAWNVGSMFRTADGVGIQRLYLCGITPTPSHPRVGRTALGAEKSISWQYASNAIALVRALISSGRRVWVLEDMPESANLYHIDISNDPRPILLIVGNEICGVDPYLLELAEQSISIPMMGSKRSYNVAVAFGIAASHLRYCQNFSQGSTRILPNT